jgi:hypothetical protein
MYDSCVPQCYFLTKNSFSQTTVTETEVIHPTGNTTKPYFDDISCLSLLLPATLLIIFWKITDYIVPLNVQKFIRDYQVFNNSFEQVPCMKCQFFDRNDYLNCAVRPSIALTEQAFNCSDYSPKSSTNGI